MNNSYAKLEPSGIKFSSNQRGTSFIVDEAGVRTCWAHFKSAKAILKSRCIVKYKETQSFKTLVYDFDHGANYPVRYKLKRKNLTKIILKLNLFTIVFIGTE